MTLNEGPHGVLVGCVSSVLCNARFYGQEVV